MDVAELICLNRQVVYREACRHAPRHESIADHVVRKYHPKAPKDVQNRARASCSPRR